MRHPGYCTKCGAEMNPHPSGLCKPHRQEAYDKAQRAARRGRRRTRDYGEAMANEDSAQIQVGSSIGRATVSKTEDGGSNPSRSATQRHGQGQREEPEMKLTLTQTYTIEEFMDCELQYSKTLRQAIIDEARADLGVEEHEGEITVQIIDNTFVCTFESYQ